MDNRSLVDDVKTFGLNEYEAKAYLALTLNGPLTASSISEKGSIPQSKVYEILRSLNLKSLTQVWPSKPCKYKAIEPNIALGRIVEEKKGNIIKLDQNIRKIVEKMHPKETNNISEMWIIKGRKLFLNMLANYVSESKEAVHLISKDFPKRSFLDEAFRKAKRNGATIKIIGSNIANKYSNVRKEWYINMGADVSSSDSNMNMGIFDNKECFIEINENEFMCIKNSFLTNILSYYYNMLWNSSKNLQ